ncbi:MAG: HAMP domain-containing histidine kinase [Actinomycetota bacterium]|nr:HAMP domain-containing histidine kinase [Actinomycetota bacterium]
MSVANVVRLRRGHDLPTLRGHVSRLALGVIAAWLGVLAAGFAFVLVTRLDRQVNDALRVRAQAASATVVTQRNRIVGVRESATDGELDSSIWIYSGARAIERPSVKIAVRRAANALATGPAGYTDRADHRFYVLPVRLDGQRAGSIVASIDLDPYERTKHTVLLGSVVVTVLLLAGAYPALRLATGRALRPVDQMTRQAAEWSITAPGQRFGAEQRYAELSSLAGTLDELLDRLAAVLRHERHLSAELSHELRTPLARVAAQVDLALDGARPDQRVELLAIRENCTLMDGIIDSLLAAARSELVRTVGRSDLQSVFAAISAQQAEPRVSFGSTDLAVGVEHDLAVRMLSPVVENARRYAATGIRLSAKRAGKNITVDVVNDGEPLDPALAERVFDPGFRAGPEGQHDGAGLGLALARRIARSADGDLVVDTEADEATFRLTLPAG